MIHRVPHQARRVLEAFEEIVEIIVEREWSLVAIAQPPVARGLDLRGGFRGDADLEPGDGSPPAAAQIGEKGSGIEGLATVGGSQIPADERKLFIRDAHRYVAAFCICPPLQELSQEGILVLG